jgi:hypothetical protein
VYAGCLNTTQHTGTSLIPPLTPSHMYLNVYRRRHVLHFTPVALAQDNRVTKADVPWPCYAENANPLSHLVSSGILTHYFGEDPSH